MIILLPAGTRYKIGNNFPLMTIPLDMPNAQSTSFEDFQWWALSSDFQKWLKKNPRKWVAESNDLGKYEGSVSEYLKENYSFLEPLYNDINESDVLSFEDFSREKMVFEDEQGDADSAEYKEAIKFHFAYNSLKSKGKIVDSMTASDIKKGDDKAVFLLLEDPANGENMMETMKAYRMTGYIDVDGKSKIRLIDVSEMLPGGPIKDDEKTEDVIGKVVQDAAVIAAAGGVGLVLYSALKIAGGGLAARALLKTIQGFSPNAASAGASAAPSLLGKIRAGGVKGIKSLWGGVKDIATLKNTRALVTRGYRFARAAYTLGKVGVGGAIKAFAKGVTRGASKLGSKAIPFVGEVLMIIDAVGSTWNWYSDNQAPRYGEVESFAKNEMNPANLPVGVPITVCWSQPAGGALGTGISFLFSNETRTTAELIKIGDKNGESIFIMTQINSKEVQEELASHDLTLISLDNSNVVNDQASSKEGVLAQIGTAIQRTFDNEDLDFKISHIDGINDIAAMFNFQGICDWSEFETAYQSAGDQLIVVDPNAPETYEFYYKDNEENVVNVSGRIVSNDELKNSNPEELQKIFYSEEIEGSAEKKNEEHDNSAILGELINESTVITSFDDFSGRLAGIYENKDIDSKKEKTTLELSREQSSTPAEVAVYVVTEREYADPELRKYKVGVFRNFMINADDYKAKVNSPIDVETNTVNEDIDEPKRGVYVFKKEADKVKPKPSEEEEIKRNTQPLTDEDPKQDDQKVKDDYYITVDPKDVIIKDKKNSTVIRDNSFAGGINLVDTFLTDKDKEIMNIANWKAVSYAKASLDTRGDIIEVKIKNKFAPFGDKVRKFKVSDGEAFEIAKKFATEVESRIKYQ
jgi:hypothetical protein